MPSSSSSALRDLTSRHQKLTSEWKKRDLSACADTLQQMRVLLTQVAFLPSDAAPGGGAGDLGDRKKELLLARDVLEIGAHLSIAQKDDAAFARYVAQLKTYYADYASVLPESAYQYELLGLNLMSLLSKNHIPEFHTELERLPSDSLQNNPYIRCPVRMEQFIMEGSYNKVLMMRENVPSEPYAFFVDRLLGTIRDEIASCMERAYEKIGSKDCAKMLQLDQRSASKYIQDRGWATEKGVVKFGKDAAALKQQEAGSGEAHARAFAEEVPTEELAKMSITYAREMEQIV